MLEDEVKPELEELDNVEVEAILEDVVDLEGLLTNTARKWGFGIWGETAGKVGKQILANTIEDTYANVDDVLG